jgi:hypothetical protein
MMCLILVVGKDGGRCWLYGFLLDATMHIGTNGTHLKLGLYLDKTFPPHLDFLLHFASLFSSNFIYFTAWINPQQRRYGAPEKSIGIAYHPGQLLERWCYGWVLTDRRLEPGLRALEDR